MSLEDLTEDRDDLRTRMSALSYEPPVTEFERRQTDANVSARRTVGRWSGFAIAFQVLAGVFGLIWLAMNWSGGVPPDEAGVACFLFWCVSAVIAAVGGVMTLRRSSLLSWWWIAFGLLPWAVVVAEFLYLLKILMSFQGFRA